MDRFDKEVAGLVPCTCAEGVHHKNNSDCASFYASAVAAWGRKIAEEGEARIARLENVEDEFSSIIVEANTIENKLRAELADLRKRLAEAKQRQREKDAEIVRNLCPNKAQHAVCEYSAASHAILADNKEQADG